MSDHLSRRELLLLGATVALQACSPRGSHNSTSITPVHKVPHKTYPHGYQYTVQKGDTLSAISRRSGISVDSIIRVNRLETHIIKPGQVVVLPGVNRLHNDPLKRVEVDDEIVDSLSRGEYHIVPRRSWTKQGVRKNNRPIGTINRITIHHTGEHGNITKLPDLEVVKRIESPRQ